MESIQFCNGMYLVCENVWSWSCSWSWSLAVIDSKSWYDVNNKAWYYVVGHGPSKTVSFGQSFQNSAFLSQGHLVMSTQKYVPILFFCETGKRMCHKTCPWIQRYLLLTFFFIFLADVVMLNIKEHMVLTVDKSINT